MSQWFNNLRIRSKLIFSFLILIIFMTILGAVAIFSQQNIQTKINTILNQDVALSSLTQHINSTMLEARQNEKEYLLSYKDLGLQEARNQYVTQIQTQVDLLLVDVDELRVLAEQEDDSEEDLVLSDEVRETITNYEEAFLNTVDMFEQRGHNNTGLEGEFYDVTYAIDDIITEHNLDNLTILFLEIQDKAKDYLLDGEEKYINKADDTYVNEVSDLIGDFRQELITTNLSSAEKAQLNILLDDYQEKFIVLTNIDSQIIDSIVIYQAEAAKLQPILEHLQSEALASESSAFNNIKNEVRTASFLILGIGGIATVLGLVVANFLSKLISLPIHRVEAAAEKISQGDLTGSVPVTSKDELGNMAASFNRMMKYQQYVADIAYQLAQGNLTVDAKPQSDKDVLGNAFKQMIINLRELTTKNEQQLWLSAGQTQLNDKVRGEQNVVELANNIVQQLCKYLDAQVGALYFLEEDILKLVGSYAYTQRKNLSNQFKVGEGIVGQAVLEKQAIVMTQVPSDYITISSGLGETTPNCIMVIPFLYEGVVLGVIEFATLNQFSPTHQEFLKRALENIGIVFHTAKTREKVNHLLQQTQEQAAELQAQEEELRATNEELQTQTESLRSSEKKLREQQAQLELTNAELEEKATALEESGTSLRKKQEILDQQNKQLKEAQQELKIKAEKLALASKYKSEFLANMSHELRTPLNSLLILARMLANNEEGNLTNDQVESAQIIYGGGQDLLNLINDILDLSKIEAGKMDFQIEPTSLEEFRQTMIRNFNHVAEEQGVQFNITLAENLPETIETDSQRAKQILTNLLSNAFKFTEKGSVTLNIVPMSVSAKTLDIETNNSQFISFQVIDTGIGITPEQQKIVFESFQQAEGGTSRKYGGTGLGLTISRELANKLGGQITLESEEGKGSTFTLYLPASNEGLPQHTKQEVGTLPTVSPSEKVPKVSSMATKAVKTIIVPDDRDNIESDDQKLLVVEDDINFAKIIYNYAQSKNFKCLIATTGEAGLELVKTHQPDAIILDLKLPGISGWGVLDTLKQNPNTRHIPVHIMSVDDENVDAYKMGAIGFLSKPVTKEDIDAVFQKLQQFSHSIKNLLIVEDDSNMRHSLKRLLSNDNIQIKTTETGTEALDLLRNQRFDCMILDLSLPDMSGFDLLNQLNNDQEITKCPIIIYTGKALTEEEDYELMKYADSVIIKGVKSPDRLLDETALFLHQVVADMPAEKRKTIQNLYSQENNLAGKHILVVDDDMRNAFALSKLLGDKGLKVTIARSGQKALESLDNLSDIDLVLMDIMMPEMDGYETMKRIRAQRKFKDLPILSLTAKAMKGDKEKCIAAGANDYLAKPIDVDRLFSMLRVWLYK